ncbi:succinyl-diaminopimelate desuccinylase [Candidiatus Paracoxiella cheracis]|uniref:succinyl-diaminopimelate desuccinylase n=1 Tax=Candidiatus Paracoxiella cheracis TaxID=3405120 RepID=UPI003BF52709
MSKTLALLKELMSKHSLTPDDAGCQDILIKRLKAANFHIKELPFGNTQNFWAWHGATEPTIVFAGHTDVVPPGPDSQWQSPPFSPTEREGYLFGRGAADMKSGLSAMIVAAENFVAENPNHNGTIGFIVTSDEEGTALDGTKRVVDYLQEHNVKLNYCVVGEASSNKQLGDAIKIGRRGSMHGELTIFGKQGHIAYPHLADNPIHSSFQALQALANHEWDQGNTYFSPTSFQFYHIHSDAGADNVIPGILKAHFNFRFAPIHTAEQLQQQCHNILDQHQLNYKIDWRISGRPFFSGNGKLATVCSEAIQSICNIKPELNTYGGTSDGRFIATTGCEVVELGPVNESIHKVNEHIKIDDVEKLTKIYQRVLELLFQ